MITTEKIYKFLEKEFPIKKAELWDKVGLIYGNLQTNVQNILISLDLTTEVFDFAISKKCELIIVHHPFLFEKTQLEDFQKAPYKRELHKRLINNNISLIVLHTNYDNAHNGMTTQLFETLGFKQFKMLNSRFGGIAETNLNFNNLLKLIADKLQISDFQTNFATDIKMAFNKIAFLPGSGDVKDIIDAHQEGAGLVFTSDVKWSTWLVAKELKIKLINYSHFVENIFIKHLANLLTKKFNKNHIYTYKVVINNFLVNIKNLENLKRGNQND